MPDTKPTHRLNIEGHALTTGSIADQSALYERIKPYYEALAEALTKEGGTLACTPQRIGAKTGKTIPAAPPSQNAPTIGDPPPVSGIAGTAPRSNSVTLDGAADSHVGKPHGRAAA